MYEVTTPELKNVIEENLNVIRAVKADEMKIETARIVVKATGGINAAVGTDIRARMVDAKMPPNKAPAESA